MKQALGIFIGDKWAINEGTLFGYHLWSSSNFMPMQRKSKELTLYSFVPYFDEFKL